MTKPTLKDLYLAHTGKVSDKWSSYFGVYERAFAAFRDSPVALLEIGVQNGGSLELWARYFAMAEAVIGCDIDQRCAALQFDDPRIDVVAADVNSDLAYDDIRSLAPAYDIIIDDGSHRSADIIAALLRYFPLVKPGGVYFIEDLHCAYLADFGGGLREPRSAMSFLKLAADLVNAQFWSGEAPVGGLFQPFLQGKAPPAFLADGSIESIEFSNSVAVLRRAVEPATLGTRVVAGDDAMIAPIVLQMHGTQFGGGRG